MGMRIGRAVVLGLGLGVLLGGCATVARGTSEMLVFESEPAGAAVQTVLLPQCDGPCPTGREDVLAEIGRPMPGPSCTTPCSVMVPRGRRLDATIAKPGFMPQQVAIRPEVAAAGAVGVAGNVLIGGSLGAFTDLASGAAYDMKPNPVKVVLVPEASAAPPQKPARRASAAKQ